MDPRRPLVVLMITCLAGATAVAWLAPQLQGLRAGLLGTGALSAGWLGWRALRQLREARAQRDAIIGVMDAADALEARLRDARGELEAIAGDHENPVRGAMQDLLRQRLWLQQHAQQASLAQLGGVRKALDDARAQLEGQLARIARARAGS